MGGNKAFMEGWGIPPVPPTGKNPVASTSLQLDENNLECCNTFQSGISTDK